jgi:hypothetical protein
MKLIHYTSLEVNPWVYINPGNNVFAETPKTKSPGIYCVAEKDIDFRHMWCTGQFGHRELLVVLDVPKEFVKLSIMGKITDLDPEVFSRECADDDNSLVIVEEYDPNWVAEVFYCSRVDVRNWQLAKSPGVKTAVIEEKIDSSFWGVAK